VLPRLEREAEKETPKE